MTFRFRFFLSLLCIGTICSIKSAEMSRHQEPIYAALAEPIFIILAENQSFFDESKAIANKLVRDGLFEVLNLIPQQEQAAIMQAGMPIPYRIMPFQKLQSPYRGPGYIEKNQQEELVKEIMLQAEQRHPIIIICDTYSTKVLKDALSACGENSIHSVIMINPSVYQPIAYKAIAHRVYNFYSKYVSRYIDVATQQRKYYPDKDRSHNSWSKIVNICCMYGCDDKDINIDLTPETIKTLNVPGMIRLADEHFQCNWDLAAMINKQEMTRVPIIFLHRMLELGGDGNLNNAHEHWMTQRLIGADLEAVKRRLAAENHYHAVVTAPYYNGSKNAWRCKALEGSPKEPITAEVYERIESRHPQWLVEVKKMGPEYQPFLTKFLCLRANYSFVSKDLIDNSNPFDVCTAFEKNFEAMRQQDVRATDSFVARMLGCAVIDIHAISSMKALRISFADAAKTQVAIENTLLGFETPENWPSLYKIHLMPSDANFFAFYMRFLKFILKDTDLWKSINSMKVIMLDGQYLNGSPRIVLYFSSRYAREGGVRDAKERTQSVLDKLYAQFKDIPGSGLVPQYNIKVTDLIYVSQGNRDDKKKPGAERIFDKQEDFVYFIPGYLGFAADFHLKIPGAVQEQKPH